MKDAVDCYKPPGKRALYEFPELMIASKTS